MKGEGEIEVTRDLLHVYLVLFYRTGHRNAKNVFDLFSLSSTSLSFAWLALKRQLWIIEKFKRTSFHSRFQIKAGNCCSSDFFEVEKPFYHYLVIVKLNWKKIKTLSVQMNQLREIFFSKEQTWKWKCLDNDCFKDYKTIIWKK